MYCKTGVGKLLPAKNKTELLCSDLIPSCFIILGRRKSLLLDGNTSFVVPIAHIYCFRLLDLHLGRLYGHCTRYIRENNWKRTASMLSMNEKYDKTETKSFNINKWLPWIYSRQPVKSTRLRWVGDHIFQAPHHARVHGHGNDKSCYYDSFSFHLHRVLKWTRNGEEVTVLPHLWNLSTKLLNGFL
jgi:hypothetical protein